MKIDLLTEYCKELRNLPAGWEYVSWDRTDGVDGNLLKVEGAVYPSKANGGIGWEGRDKTTECTFTIKISEHQAWELEWEKRSGQCKDCVNTPGQKWNGWSAIGGNKYIPCRRCNATGKAPTK